MFIFCPMFAMPLNASVYMCLVLTLPMIPGERFRSSSLYLVFVMLSHLFIAALWSPEGNGLTSWLLFVMFIVILLHSHLVS